MRKKMIEELKSEEIVNKVGGRFKLTALVQRRLSELLQGSRPLIEDSEGKTMLEIVVQEILQDKIAIDDGLPSNIPGDEKNN
jgi:DNA-directed RNA polymerase subunit omega